MIKSLLTQRTLFIVAILSFVFPGSGWLAAQWVFQPNNSIVGALPDDLKGQVLYLHTQDNVTLPAWLIKGRADQGGLLLLHERGGSRRSMLARARFLNAEGYTVLVPDLRGEGEAEPVLRGLGVVETKDVEAALDELRKIMGPRKIGIIGVSKGAAAAVFSRPAQPVSALVLESMYGNLQQAVTARMVEHLGEWSERLGRLFAAPLAFGMGVGLDNVSPMLALSNLKIPKLIISGDEDTKPNWQQTQQIFDHAAEPKQLLKISGAGHEDLYAFSRTQWESQVSIFLAQHLQGPNAYGIPKTTPAASAYPDVPKDL